MDGSIAAKVSRGFLISQVVIVAGDLLKTMSNWLWWSSISLFCSVLKLEIFHSRGEKNVAAI
jgi:hypothetical protein